MNRSFTWTYNRLKGLKIRVSVVRFRVWAPYNKASQQCEAFLLWALALIQRVTHLLVIHYFLLRKSVAVMESSALMLPLPQGKVVRFRFKWHIGGGIE